MMSIGMNSDTVVCMMRTLKDFIISRREDLGWNQTELANHSGVPRTTVNRVEKGTTKLPEADVRRKLAAALGVRHVDILIAAGELAEDEVEFPEDPRSDAVRKLQPAIDAITWNDGLLKTTEQYLDTLRKMQRGIFPIPELMKEEE